MKAAILSILSIVLVVVLIIGNIHWNIRGDSPLSPIHETHDSTVSQEKSSNPESYFSLDYYMGFAKSWPEQAQQVLEAKLSDKKAFHILLVGSDSIGDQESGLLTPLKEALSSKYDQYVTIDSIVYDGTTSDYVNDEEYESLIDKKPDMVIFEPFLLHDNDKAVNISTTLTNINKVIKETKDSLPDVTFVLMPAHPLYEANLYPMQVSDLEKYAEAEEIPYWNHWEAWPDSKDEKVKDYYKKLADDKSIANEQGFEVWSEYLADKLISE
ncbi:SGNH/GDSL hydrolase family protein [Niallia circulans]|uniref:SGNH/GDSL hydrolase family protein n=1 Tax=Niallia circulans TaxID=1397 RepID=UPI001490366A|nr:SGNH/GDSL hydrolase family protein [Niallia circulans]QJX64166.1 SGNH/GDSL hydrolase family protein [Niallia circulans]